MIVKKVIGGLVAIALILTTITGCGSSQTSSIKLVPQAANIVANVQIGNILNDQQLISVYDGISKGADKPQTVQAALDEVTQKTGINLRDFNQGLIFGDVNSMQTDTANGYFGLIAQGTFNEKQFVKNIGDKSGKPLVASTYNGSQVYSNSVDQYSLVFFGSSMLVFGSNQAVKDCIDVQKGTKPPLSGLIVDTYNQLGTASIKAAFTVPAQAQQAIGADVPDSSATSVQALSKMDMIGLAINKGTLDVTVSLSLHFPDASSATDAKDTISGAVNVYKGMETNQAIKKLLGEIQFSTSDVWLNISLQSALADLQSLSQSKSTK